MEKILLCIVYTEENIFLAKYRRPSIAVLHNAYGYNSANPQKPTGAKTMFVHPKSALVMIPACFKNNIRKIYEIVICQQNIKHFQMLLQGNAVILIC